MRMPTALELKYKAKAIRSELNNEERDTMIEYILSYAETLNNGDPIMYHTSMGTDEATANYLLKCLNANGDYEGTMKPFNEYMGIYSITIRLTECI